MFLRQPYLRIEHGSDTQLSGGRIKYDTDKPAFNGYGLRHVLLYHWALSSLVSPQLLEDFVYKRDDLLTNTILDPKALLWRRYCDAMREVLTYHKNGFLLEPDTDTPDSTPKAGGHSEQ